jgi:hypothetical protein
MQTHGEQKTGPQGIEEKTLKFRMLHFSRFCAAPKDAGLPGVLPAAGARNEATGNGWELRTFPHSTDLELGKE